MLEAVEETVYGSAVFIADLIGKPLDQAIYMIASVATLIVSLILYQIQAEIKKKAFSLTAGLLINFYVFGTSAFASMSQNLISFALLKMWP